MTSLESALDGLEHERGARGQAWFSADRAHRYLLLRGGDLGDDAPLVAFVMLNPSTADADQDDPTIKKCIKFAARFDRREGVRVAIVNLFAVRATDPDVAFAHPRPVGGPQNDRVIAAVASESTVTIAAWGADKRSAGRAREVRQLLAEGSIPMHRLGPSAKDGSPKHPLYLRDAIDLEVHP